MKALKLGDVRDFDFVQPPPPKAIADGYAILSELHALEKNGELTDVGRMLSRLPANNAKTTPIFSITKCPP